MGAGRRSLQSCATVLPTGASCCRCSTALFAQADSGVLAKIDFALLIRIQTLQDEWKQRLLILEAAVCSPKTVTVDPDTQAPVWSFHKSPRDLESTAFSGDVSEVALGNHLTVLSGEGFRAVIRHGIFVGVLTEVQQARLAITLPPELHHVPCVVRMDPGRNASMIGVCSMDAFTDGGKGKVFLRAESQHAVIRALDSVTGNPIRFIPGVCDDLSWASWCVQGPKEHHQQFLAEDESEPWSLGRFLAHGAGLLDMPEP